MKIGQNVKIKEGTVEAFITKADGTVVNLGVIDYTNSNPLKMLKWKLSYLLRRLKIF